MGVSWTSDEQEPLLISEIANFLQAQLSQTTDRFFARFFTVWFSRFKIPEDVPNRGEEIEAMREVCTVL
jgi:hypothetical protein